MNTAQLGQAERETPTLLYASMIEPELLRLRAHLERIVKIAHQNPDCLVCAEMRRVASAGLKPAPLLFNTWQT